MVLILHLTLKKKWFDLIASGQKTVEYREMKPYWEKRLFDKERIYPRHYDEIHFRNGYSKNAPFMRVEYKALGNATFENKACYAIRLGKVLEVRR